MLCVFRLLLAILWCLISQFFLVHEVSIKWICSFLLNCPRDRKIEISCDRKKCCSWVPYLGWWCYTGGVPHPNNKKRNLGARKSTETNKKRKKKKSIFDQVFWLEQWLKLLLQTDQWVCLGWGWQENTLVKQVAMAQLEVLFLGTDKPMVPLHSACSGKVFIPAHRNLVHLFWLCITWEKCTRLNVRMIDSHWVYVA